MNIRRLVTAAVVMLAVVACRNHERTITGSYGNGMVSGQVSMASTMSNLSPAGVEVSVQGTGMATVLGADGRFSFAAVPENAILHFRRATDGIDATTSVTGPSMAVELSAKSASSGARRRSAPVTPLLQLEGTISSIDTTAGSIVVSTSFKTDVPVMVTTDTVIRKGQTPVAVGDLKVGDRVHVKTTLKDKVYTATEIIVQNDGTDGSGDGEQSVTANGIVTSTATTSMVVHTASGRDVTVQVDPTSTNIKKYGQPIAFSAIKQGDQVECRGTAVDATTIKAVQIEVQNAPGRDEASIEGTAGTVGATSLTVHTDSGDVTVNTDAHTSIRKQGKSIGLSDVHSGDSVAVRGSWVDAHTILADSIEVHGGGHD